MVGETIRLLRTRLGVGVATLAASTGVEAKEIEEIEAGAEGSDPATVVRLVVALARQGPEGYEAPAPDLDDVALIARQREMSMAVRLESGFALCRFASQLTGTARR